MALTLIGTPLVLIPTDTALAVYDITSGIDDTYDSYQFHLVNMHPANDGVGLRFQVNSAGGDKGFDESIISTMFVATHGEDGGSESLAYNTADQELGTDYPLLNFNTGNNNDQSCSGVLTLFAPSSTTYLKHYTYNGVTSSEDDKVHNHFVAGYINVTAAIDEIRFKFSGGNIQAGTIKMFGVT